MYALSRAALCAVFVAMFAATAEPQPVISGTSTSTLPRSGRLLIAGSGFGAAKGSSIVQIGGITAWVTRWSDALIAAYVPETASTGTVPVQVVTGAGSSNIVPLFVTLRQPSGRVKWRFQADSPYFFHRPAIGPDGTIIAHDAGGFVYALSPSGGLKWVYHTRVFAGGPPSVGADGSVYVGDSTTVTALMPDGTLKWSFTDPDVVRAIAAGPTVGPDGKIYAFFDPFHVYALTPSGAVAWHDNLPNLFDLFEWGAEWVFGPSQPGQPANQAYLSFGVNPDGYLWAFNMGTGSIAFATHQANTWDPSMQPQGQAAVSSDGTIYTGSSLLTGSSSSVNAFNPNGTVKWSVERFGGISAPDVGPNGNTYFVFQAGLLGALNSSGGTLWNVFDGVNMLQYPIANPAGGMVFVGGGQNGQPGFVRAYNATNGAILWQIDLGSENGGNQWLGSRPRFAADGQTVYFGTTIPTASADSYCYLYAVDTSGGTTAPVLSSLTLSPSSVTGGSPSTGQVTLSGSAPAGGAIVTLASSNTAVATVPVSVTIPQGLSSAAFAVVTKSVATTTAVTISATYAGVTKTAVLTVNPQTGSDAVAIQTAEYRVSKRQLKVQATSTNSTAILKVYVTSTGAFIGTLNNIGGGKYQGQFGWPANPVNITVRSNLGGSASKPVTPK